LPLAIDWQQMLAVLAIGSLLVGNLAAIAQSNLKRMLAFSTISQMGFLLLALLAGVVNGNKLNAEFAYGAAMFYAITYVLTTLAVFGIMLLLSRQGHESEEIADLAGLNQRSPLFAGVMAVCMFSLAGVPPVVGFYAKLGVMMSLVGAFYYLRVVKVMYFDAPNTGMPTAIHAPADARVVLSINGALVLLLGIMPGGLMTLCTQAIASVVKSLGA
jgi:NADH-quinone oxidoreductase subunit N